MSGKAARRPEDLALAEAFVLWVTAGGTDWDETAMAARMKALHEESVRTGRSVAEIVTSAP
jgi:hypothetical protein